jgi:hypothetical protein
MAYTSPEVEERVMEDIVDRLRVLNFMGPWQEAADEIEKLREALREIYEVYAGSEGIPQPMTAAEGYLLSLLMEVVGIAQKALKEKE